MNILKTIHQNYTYAEIVERMKLQTGRTYSANYIGNVARGSARISDGLKLNLMLTFPDFFSNGTNKNVS